MSAVSIETVFALFCEETFMHLYWFLLVISALASDSLPVREVPTGRAIVASFGVMIGWALLARLAVRTASRQVLLDGTHGSLTSTLLNKQMDALRWLGLCLSMLALAGFGLAGLINQLPWGSQSITVRALLLLIPGLSATAWSWYCEFRFDQAVFPHFQRIAWHKHLGQMFRLQAAWLVAPVIVLLAVIDLTQFLFDFGPTQGALLSGGIALVALPLLLPAILGRIWKLEALDETSAAWINPIVAGSNIRGTRVMRWNTDGAFCTAMVAGFVPRFRRLLLSDELLWRLSPQQTAMVVLHELAHIHRFHLPMRLLVLVPVWGLATLASQLLGDFPYADIVGIATGLAFSLLALRWVAYRTEFDADAVAVRMAGDLAGKVDVVPPTPALASAALADALMLVTADHPGARKATWMHPSIDARCEALLKPHALHEHTIVPLVLTPHGSEPTAR